jgi:peptide/nickel transport system substrate-binding protein
MSMRVSAVLSACVIVFACLGGPAGSSAQGPAGSSAQGRKELRVGVAGVPATLDPAAALEGATPLIARQVFDTLVVYREGSTEIEPALATRWAVSREGLVWTFTLREGVRFHDGSPLTAAEVAASFQRQIGPDASGAAWAALLRGRPGVIKEVRASDARTVQFILVQPYAPLLTVLAHPALAVARATTGPDGVPRLVGSGPYRVVDASAGRVATEAVRSYWGGPARIERIVFLEVVSDDNAEAEFDARALDIWFPPGPPRRMAGALSTPGLRVGYLAFQTEKEPFSRKKIRHAVAAALDPAVLGVALDNGAVPLPSFLPAGVWARREGSPVLGGTRDTVRTLLAGGWPKGHRATMLASDETGAVNIPRLAATVETALGAADIPIQVRIETADKVRTALQAGEHEMALVETMVVGGDPHLFLFPLSTSEAASKGPRALNYSFYRNPRLDDVLVRASQLSSRPERARLYQRAQALLADDLPWLPIYVRLVWGVARPEVRNLRLHPTGVHRLHAVSLEGIPGLLP